MTRAGAEAEQKAEEIKRRLGDAMQGADLREQQQLGEQMGRELEQVEIDRQARISAARRKARPQEFSEDRDRKMLDGPEPTPTAGVRRFHDRAGPHRPRAASWPSRRRHARRARGPHRSKSS
jgi:hypothetical protein